MIIILLFIIVNFTIALIISHRFKISVEKYFNLKLILYFILSSIFVYFNNKEYIPFGLLISLILASISTKNKISKCICIFIGFICSIICVILYNYFCL